MIKGRSPFPFETIALAVSFSPELPFLVLEMKRLCDIHNALAVFIHVGKKTSEKQRVFSELLVESGFHDGNSRIYWEHGDLIPSLLQVCKTQVVDLLLAGASDKENLQLPLGSTALELAGKAKCSVLILTNSNKHGFRKIAVNGIEHDKRTITVISSIYFAEKENADEISIVGDSNQQDDNADWNFHEQEVISSGLSNLLEDKKINIRNYSLADENCNSVSDFAFKNHCDLLITNSTDHRMSIFDRIVSPNGIESILNNLSCNLLIIHSRIQG
jgi:nucleotide-binding universal stress UspA family protein